MKDKKCWFFNSMYLRQVCHKCKKSAGTTCATCDKPTCKDCHRSLDGIIMSAMFAVVLAIVYFFVLYPKLEVCKTYYAELSTWSCVMSRYGLPYKK